MYCVERPSSCIIKKKKYIYTYVYFHDMINISILHKTSIILFCLLSRNVLHSISKIFYLETHRFGIVDFLKRIIIDSLFLGISVQLKCSKTIEDFCYWLLVSLLLILNTFLNFKITFYRGSFYCTQVSDRI